MIVVALSLACSDDPGIKEGPHTSPDPPATSTPTDPTTPGPTGDTAAPPPVVHSCGELGPVVVVDGTGSDFSDAVAVAADGAYYGGGAFGGEIQPGGGAVLTAAGDGDGIVLRHAADGTVEWAKHLASPTAAPVTALGATPDGGVVAVGGFYDDAIFGYGGPNPILLDSAGEGDGFVAKIAADGATEWVSTIRGRALDQPYGVAVLADGAVMVVGRSLGDVIFGDGEPNETLVERPQGATFVAWVARFEPDGTLGWAESIGGAPNVGATDAVVDPTTGDLVVVGNIYGGTATFPGPAGIVVPAGADGVAYVARWSPAGGATSVLTTAGGPVDVDVTAAGVIVVSGSFSNDIVLGAGEPNETVLSSPGRNNGYAAAYAPGGALIWATHLAAPEGNSYGRGIAGAPDGGAVVVGDYYGRLTLGPGDPTEITFQADGLGDVYAARFDASGALVCAVRVMAYWSDYAGDVAARPDGSYVVAGRFQYGATFDVGGPAEVFVQGDGELTGFLASWWF